MVVVKAAQQARCARGSRYSCRSRLDDFGGGRRSAGDFAVGQDQQGPDHGGCPLRVGVDLAEDPPVLEMGEPVLDRRPDGGERLVGQFPPSGQGEAPWEVTEFGRKVLPKAQQAVHKWAEITRIGSATVVVEFLPQHAYFVSPVAAHLRDHMEIKLAPLSEHDRDLSRFEEVVVGRVADGVSDLVIGLPPKSLAKLEKTYLYTSRLEAMIPRVDDDRRDHLTLHEAAGISYTPSPSTARKG